MNKCASYENVEKGPVFGIRHLQCFLLFWALTFGYAMRVNFSLAIVAMTDNKSANPDFEEFDWNEKEKSLLLSSFFWGYFATQIPGGYFARRFGGKVSLGIGLFISSIAAIMTPMSARIGNWQFLFALRVLQGMSQGMVYPSTHTLLAKWSHKDERGVFATYAYSGSQFGTVAMFMSGGLIASSWMGWPGIFYVSGGFGLLWTICWYFWGASAPDKFPKISSAEKSYIELSLLKESQQKSAAGATNTILDKHMKTPWLKFLKSPPFWALLATQTGFAWAYWTIITQIPAYMKNILGFNIKSNALLSALPYLTMLLLNFAFSALATLIQKRNWLSLTASRKLLNTIAMWLPAAALAALGYLDATQAIWAVILLVIAVGLNAGIHVGYMVNHIDLSPNFAGILLGCANMVANSTGVFAPLTVGFIVTDEKNPIQWRIVFFIAAGFSFFGNLLFLLFGTAKVQSWNEPEHIPVSTDDPPNSNEESKSIKA